MAYPSGSGSEILRRGAIHNLANDTTSLKFDGTSPTTGTETYAVPANHIISLLSITVTDMSATSGKNFSMWTVLGGANIKILEEVPVDDKETYVFDSRIVLHPTDTVKLFSDFGGSNYDVFYTYIDQDWT